MKKYLFITAFLFSMFTGSHAINLEQVVKESKNFSGKERIEFISRQFENSKYGRILTRWPDEEQLVINLDTLDCFTYIEYVLAINQSKNADEFPSIVQKMRYNGDEIDYTKRNHFFVDWIRDNQEYLHNITNHFNGHRYMLKRLNKPGIKEHRYFCFVPFDSCCNSLETGDFVGFYSPEKDLDVSHVGRIIKKQNQQEPWLRHFSLWHGYEEINLKKLSHKQDIRLIIARPRYQ